VTELQFIVALSNCIDDVLKPDGVDTVVILTTTELDVEEHPAGVVTVKLYVPAEDTLYVDPLAPDITPLASLQTYV
tara:strand:+ start:916 stop:1143 length:228 start_codon:yes stop_codon:yes gene_type:complete